jgi:hypothetical protein
MVLARFVDSSRGSKSSMMVFSDELSGIISGENELWLKRRNTEYQDKRALRTNPLWE